MNFDHGVCDRSSDVTLALDEFLEQCPPPVGGEGGDHGDSDTFPDEPEANCYSCT